MKIPESKHAGQHCGDLDFHKFYFPLLPLERRQRKFSAIWHATNKVTKRNYS